MCPSRRFTSSSAKDYIRSNVDRALIEEFKRTVYPDRLLSYLGLPGKELLDVLSWREFIGRCTAIEHQELADELELNVLLNRLENVVRIVCGDIDDLIGSDQGRMRLCWPYELINLDYIGGLVNAREAGGSRRLEALKALLAQQAGTAFLLFLTINLRDNDRGELEELVRQQEGELIDLGLSGVEECFRRHREFGHAGLLKVYVPMFLDTNAPQHTLVCNAPVLYQGTRQMIHFALQCVPYVGLSAGRPSRTRSRVDLINLPLYTLHSAHDHAKRIDLGSIK